MFILSTIPQPKVKLYFVEGNKFSTNREEAMIFNSRELAMEKQAEFPDLDLQIESV